MTNEELAAIEARAAAVSTLPGDRDNHLNYLVKCFEKYRVVIDTDIPALVAEVKRLQSGITKIESRWREASEDKCFRSHYRGTMSECADELRSLLAGSVDEDALRAEIDKAFEGGKL